MMYRKNFTSPTGVALRVTYKRQRTGWGWSLADINGQHVYARSSCIYRSRPAAAHAFRVMQLGLVLGAETVHPKLPIVESNQGELFDDKVRLSD